MARLTEIVTQLKFYENRENQGIENLLVVCQVGVSWKATTTTNNNNNNSNPFIYANTQYPSGQLQNTRKLKYKTKKHASKQTKNKQTYKKTQDQEIAQYISNN